jgi:hypothetical protein
MELSAAHKKCTQSVITLAVSPVPVWWQPKKTPELVARQQLLSTIARNFVTSSTSKISHVRHRDDKATRNYAYRALQKFRCELGTPSGEPTIGITQCAEWVVVFVRPLIMYITWHTRLIREPKFCKGTGNDAMLQLVIFQFLGNAFITTNIYFQFECKQFTQQRSHEQIITRDN